MDYNVILEKQAKKHGEWILKSFADRKIDINCIELEQYSRKLAWWMKNKGIQKGDAVGCWMGNTPECLMILIACWRIGAVCVPLSFYENIECIKNILDECNAKLFFWDGDNKYIKMHNTKELIGIDVAKEPLCGKCRFGFLNEDDGSRLLRCKIENEDEIAIIYTSGSTGVKKGIRKNLKSFWGEKGFQKYYRRLINLSKSIYPLHLVNSYPWYHNAGMLLLSVTANGALYHEITAERFRIPDVVEYINKYRPKLWLGTATMLYRCCVQMDGKLKRIPEFIVVGGDGLTRTMVEVLESYSGGILLYSAYGTTEAGVISSICYRFRELSLGMQGIVWILKKSKIIKQLFTLNDLKADANNNALGNLNSGVEVLIYDEEQKQALEDGKNGEICVKTNAEMTGYVGAQENSIYLDYNGQRYIRTGDIGYMKEHMLFLSGRKKNMIIRSGENILPTEIELVIESVPGVREVVVCGVPDKNYGEAVCACIEVEEGFELENVKNAIREKLPKYMFPQYFEIVNEIPMNASGKKDVKKMRERIIEKI